MRITVRDEGPRAEKFILDIYCYQCNDSRLDPELATHLSSFGINVRTQKKTEKSVTELVCLQNVYIASYIELTAHGFYSK